MPQHLIWDEAAIDVYLDIKAVSLKQGLPPLGFLSSVKLSYIYSVLSLPPPGTIPNSEACVFLMGKIHPASGLECLMNPLHK